MDRRSIENGAYGLCTSIGMAAIVGSFALPPTSGAFWPLSILGGLATLIGAGGLARLWFTALKQTENPVSEERSEPVIGLDVQSSNGGTGLDIHSVGDPLAPSFGGESIVEVPHGQGAIGARTIQNGPGTGIRVVQHGPGVGFRSVARVGKPEDKP